MNTRATLLAKLDQHLHALRDGLDTAVQHYTLRVQAVIADALRAVAAATTTPERHPLPTRSLKLLVARLERLTVKPKKGRVKDLKRIDQLAADIAKLLESIETS
jgi:flagellar hook-associated protein FlgK